MGDVVKASIMQAATKSERELLVALRDKVASELESDSMYPRDIYALSKHLIEIRRQIEEIDKAASAPKSQMAGAVEVPDERWNAS